MSNGKLITSLVDRFFNTIGKHKQDAPAQPSPEQQRRQKQIMELASHGMISRQAALDEFNINVMDEIRRLEVEKAIVNPNAQVVFRREHQNEPFNIEPAVTTPRDPYGNLVKAPGGWSQEMLREHEAERERRKHEAARAQERRNRITEMCKKIGEVVEKLKQRGGTGWFKRGDVARLLKISSEEAGNLLHELKKEGEVHCENGWWHYSVTRTFMGTPNADIPNAFMDQMMQAMAVPSALWSAPLTSAEAQIVKSGIQNNLRGIAYK